MRWSERPPAVRSRLTWLVRLHCERCSLSLAVAHLILVRSMRAALFVLAIVLMPPSGLAAPPCDAPIPSRDVRQISRVVRTLTAKPILFIMAVVEDKPVPGAVTGLAWIEDVATGTRTPRYTRTDWVDVYTRGSKTDLFNVYSIRKVHGKWKRVSTTIDWVPIVM
jgi:hypothetical protein